MTRLRWTIFAKLLLLVACALVVSLVTVVGVSSRLYSSDSTALIQALGADTAGHLAADLRDSFGSLTEKMRFLGELALEPEGAFPSKGKVVRDLFSSDKDHLAFYLHAKDGEGKSQRIFSLVSPELEAADSQGNAVWAAISSLPGFSLERVTQGSVEIAPLKLENGTAALVLGIPFVKSESEPGRFTHAATLVVRETRLTAAFADQALLGSFLVDKNGRLLAPSVLGTLRAGEVLTHKEIVRELLSGKLGNEEKRYIDPQSHEALLAAFHTVGFGGLGIVTEVPEAKAFAPVERVRKDSWLVGIAVLALAFLGAYFFSNTITWPLKQLVQVAQRIASGDFDFVLKPRSRDEVAELSLAFNGMAKGLKERDFVKETFNKFHNREVAEKLLSGEVKLGGEQKEVTIFFSDIRGFTALSEGMTAEAVVEMLNEYMTRMVAVIRKYGGVVDKYVGDAIMAVWGAPITGTSDPYNAVSACLEMRKELMKLNQARMARRQPVLYIGMGLNTGTVVAGNIGSDQKMEYTVIGDAVNTASRIESMTKELGTDLLVSKSVHDKVVSHFVFDSAVAVQVKGKSRALEVFKVLGYVDSMGAPVLVQTPYSSYESGHSDKAARAA